MRIAFVHDWFTVPAGAEKVAREIIDVIRPHAIFTLFNHMSDDDLREITQGIPVHTSFLQNVPLARKHYRLMAPLFPLAVRRFDLGAFDVIISSSWMVAKGVKTNGHQQHHCYCHTPMRFAWGLEETYLTQHGMHKGPGKFLAKLAIERLRRWDRDTAKNVDQFMANSHFIQQRINTAYDRSSKVIFPPVATRNFPLHPEKESFYFMATRLVDYKNVDLVIEAFRRLPDRKLLISGDGPMRKRLESAAGKNVEFLGWIPNWQLKHYMQRAKAFINASIEDFGIAGVEAQATGTPVIAFAKGGYTETVVESVTGTFFHRLHPEALADAVLRLEQLHIDPVTVSEHAKRFDTSVFREQFLNHILDKAVANVGT